MQKRQRSTVDLKYTRECLRQIDAETRRMPSMKAGSYDKDLMEQRNECMKKALKDIDKACLQEAMTAIGIYRFELSQVGDATRKRPLTTTGVMPIQSVCFLPRN